MKRRHRTGRRGSRHRLPNWARSKIARPPKFASANDTGPTTRAGRPSNARIRNASRKIAPPKSMPFATVEPLRSTMRSKVTFEASIEPLNVQRVQVNVRETLLDRVQIEIADDHYPVELRPGCPSATVWTISSAAIHPASAPRANPGPRATAHSATTASVPSRAPDRVRCSRVPCLRVAMTAHHVFPAGR